MCLDSASFHIFSIFSLVYAFQLGTIPGAMLSCIVMNAQDINALSNAIFKILLFISM